MLCRKPHTIYCIDNSKEKFIPGSDVLQTDFDFDITMIRKLFASNRSKNNSNL